MNGKKRNKKKLAVKKNAVKHLTQAELKDVVGGMRYGINSSKP